MITAQEEKLTELENLCEAASEELEKTAELMDKVSRLYDELISYADLYDSANFEATKYSAFLVENTGIEPVTSCMPCKRSPS